MSTAAVVRLSWFVLAVLAATSGCGRGPATPQAAEAASPLGKSYVLIPLPSDDDSLLGRMLVSPPEPGRALEELTQPNPCADKLEPAKSAPMTNTFEDAMELAFDAKATATLGVFGFQADAKRATHFLYKVSTEKRIGRLDTAAYLECCSAQNCGYGYVSALIYGEGEYSSGEETAASAKVDVVTVGGTSGNVVLKVLHKRKVRGWFAAIVKPRDPSKSDDVGPLGVAKKAGITEASTSDEVKALYDREKISICAPDGSGWHFCDSRGGMTENDFARRYRLVTDSDEIAHADRRRNTGALIGWGIGWAASIGTLVYGVTHLKENCPADVYCESGKRTNVAGSVATFFGGGSP